MKDLNHYVSIFKEQLAQGDIRIAYDGLVKFVMQLRGDLIKNVSDRYSFASVQHGYMDYTYFYYTNDYLKSKKLKLGLVLNHVEMRFEIWLLGRTKEVQQSYWEALKKSVWNKDRTEMPTYSILEAVIEENPDFNDLPLLSKIIENQLIEVSQKIIDAVEQLD